MSILQCRIHLSLLQFSYSIQKSKFKVFSEMQGKLLAKTTCAEKASPFQGIKLDTKNRTENKARPKPSRADITSCGSM